MGHAKFSCGQAAFYITFPMPPEHVDFKLLQEEKRRVEEVPHRFLKAMGQKRHILFFLAVHWLHRSNLMTCETGKYRETMEFW